MILLKDSFLVFLGGEGRGAVRWNCRENWEANGAVLKNHSRKDHVYQQEQIVTNEKNVNKETINNPFLKTIISYAAKTLKNTLRPQWEITIV